MVYRPIGWRFEPYRHSLAARGISTKMSFAASKTPYMIGPYTGGPKRPKFEEKLTPDQLQSIFDAIDKDKVVSPVGNLDISYLQEQIYNVTGRQVTEQDVEDLMSSMGVQIKEGIPEVKGYRYTPDGELVEESVKFLSTGGVPPDFGRSRTGIMNKYGIYKIYDTQPSPFDKKAFDAWLYEKREDFFDAETLSNPMMLAQAIEQKRQENIQDIVNIESDQLTSWEVKEKEGDGDPRRKYIYRTTLRIPDNVGVIYTRFANMSRDDQDKFIKRLASELNDSELNGFLMEQGKRMPLSDAFKLLPISTQKEYVNQLFERDIESNISALHGDFLYNMSPVRQNEFLSKVMPNLGINAEAFKQLPYAEQKQKFEELLSVGNVTTVPLAKLLEERGRNLTKSSQFYKGPDSGPMVDEEGNVLTVEQVRSIDPYDRMYGYNYTVGRGMIKSLAPHQGEIDLLRRKERDRHDLNVFASTYTGEPAPILTNRLWKWAESLSPMAVDKLRAIEDKTIDRARYIGFKRELDVAMSSGVLTPEEHTKAAEELKDAYHEESSVDNEIIRMANESAQKWVENTKQLFKSGRSKFAQSIRGKIFKMRDLPDVKFYELADNVRQDLVKDRFAYGELIPDNERAGFMKLLQSEIDIRDVAIRFAREYEKKESQKIRGKQLVEVSDTGIMTTPGIARRVESQMEGLRNKLSRYKKRAEPSDKSRILSKVKYFRR